MQPIAVFIAILGQVVDELAGHESWIAGVTVGRSGTRVAAGSQGRTVRVWNLQSSRQEFVLEGFADRVNSVSFSPDGSVLATASRDRTVRLFDARSGAPVGEEAVIIELKSVE